MKTTIAIAFFILTLLNIESDKRLFAEPGYKPRACGLDTNRNSRMGEAADARLADGRTLDPDGDGVREDLIYVAADIGDDRKGDGTAARPFKTIQRALDACDGPADGAEDIVCISGVFHEAITITQSGVAGHYERDGFQFPKNPMTIVGWDCDGDGIYPPYDKDDVAVMDGSREGQQNLPLAISNRKNNCSYVEIAHLTIRNYGFDMPKSGEKIPRAAFAPASAGEVSHIYVHDVSFESINEGIHTDGYSHVVYFWIGGRTKFTWFAFNNNNVNRFSGYGFRGVASNGSGHFRIQGNTWRFAQGKFMHTGKLDLGLLWKVWNSHNYVEFLDNHCIGDPAPSGIVGFGVRPSVQDVVIRGNRFDNMKIAVSVDGYSRGFGQNRYVDRITIERNVIVNKWDKYPATAYGGPIGIFIPEGSDLQNTVRNVTIEHNSLIFSQPNGRGIICIGGNDEGPQLGTIIIRKNQFIGPGRGRDYVGLRLHSNKTYPHQNFIVSGNQFLKTGPSGHHIITNYVPTAWKADNNVYDGGPWKWNNSQIVDLPAWQKATGQDKNARIKSSQEQ